MAYVRQVWRNFPDTSTPTSAEALRHMEDGIGSAADAADAALATALQASSQVQVALATLAQHSDIVALQAVVAAQAAQIADLTSSVQHLLSLVEGDALIVTPDPNGGYDLTALGAVTLTDHGDGTLTITDPTGTLPIVDNGDETIGIAA